jgi:pilus assembly protein FimV
LPTPSQFAPSVHDTAVIDASIVDLDLDLDGDSSGPVSAPAPLHEQSFDALASPPTDAMSLDLTMPDMTMPASPAPSPSAQVSGPVDFDLAGISLDLDLPAGQSAGSSASGFGDSDLPLDDIGDSGDPLSRKLELAEEFRQIGDMEGARDLLQEVVAKASGGLKSKAQGMLDNLG